MQINSAFSPFVSSNLEFTISYPGSLHVLLMTSTSSLSHPKVAEALDPHWIDPGPDEHTLEHIRPIYD